MSMFLIKVYKLPHGAEGSSLGRHRVANIFTPDPGLVDRFFNFEEEGDLYTTTFTRHVEDVSRFDIDAYARTIQVGPIIQILEYETDASDSSSETSRKAKMKTGTRDTGRRLVARLILRKDERWIRALV